MYLANILALTALTTGRGAPIGPVLHPDPVCPSRLVPLEGRKLHVHVDWSGSLDAV